MYVILWRYLENDTPTEGTEPPPSGSLSVSLATLSITSKYQCFLKAARPSRKLPINGTEEDFVGITKAGWQEAQVRSLWLVSSPAVSLQDLSGGTQQGQTWSQPQDTQFFCLWENLESKALPSQHDGEHRLTPTAWGPLNPWWLCQWAGQRLCGAWSLALLPTNWRVRADVLCFVLGLGVLSPQRKMRDDRACLRRE